MESRVWWTWVRIDRGRQSWWWNPKDDRFQCKMVWYWPALMVGDERWSFKMETDVTIASFDTAELECITGHSCQPTCHLAYGSPHHQIMNNVPRAAIRGWSFNRLVLIITHQTHEQQRSCDDMVSQCLVRTPYHCNDSQWLFSRQGLTLNDLRKQGLWVGCPRNMRRSWAPSNCGAICRRRPWVQHWWCRVPGPCLLTAMSAEPGSLLESIWFMCKCELFELKL